jgi:hypothetical protein
LQPSGAVVPVEKCALFSRRICVRPAFTASTAAGCNAPTGCISAVGLEGRADEALQVAALQDSLAPQEAARIVRIGEPMNHIYANHQNRLIAGLVTISPEPIAINGGNDAQAQPTSKVPAFFAPSLYCRTTEVSGVM